MVQPGLVYGPGDTAQSGALLEQVVRGKRPQVPNGGGACWAHVDDVAAGHALAMERARRGVLHAGRAAVDAGRRAPPVAAIAGTKGPMVLPDGMVRATAAVLAAVGRVVPLPPDFAAETLRASLATYYGSPAKAERDLGWRARDLDTGLRETVAALR